MRRPLVALCAVGALLALVCAPVHADKLSNLQKQLAKSYPGERYVTAIGISAASAEQAIEQAKSEVSAQIRSELSSVLTTEQSSVSKDGNLQELQRIVSRTESRTSFVHAELIKLDNRLMGRDHGQWYAVATLDRNEAAGVFQHDYEMVAADFRTGARGLLEPGGELLAWTAGLRHAEADFRRLLEIMLPMRGLRRRPEGFDEDFELYQKLQQERIHRLASVRLALQIDSPKDDPGPLAAFVGDALSKLGLGAIPQGCAEGGYVLNLNPRFTWEQGMFGPVIRLAVPARLIRCQGLEPVGQLEIDDADFVGTDTRDKSRALNTLWQNIKQERLVVLLRGELSRYLPVSQM